MTDRTYTLLPPGPDAPPHDFIYFMYSAGRIKIGYSRGTATRHKQLITAGPFPPVCILMMHGTLADEADLHVRFREDRLHGEWFNLSDDMRAYLRRRLCDIGRDSLDRAEVEFFNYCQSFLAGFRSPPFRRTKRETCSHGMPLGCICYPCERERGLEILKGLEAAS